MKYDGPFYEPKPIKSYNPQINPDAEKEMQEALNGVLKCEVSGKPFKLQPNELRWL